MDSQQLYVRAGGQTRGPYPLERIREGVRAGKLLPTYDGSYDGVAWFPLQTIWATLTEPATPAKPAEPVPAVAAKPIAPQPVAPAKPAATQPVHATPAPAPPPSARVVGELLRPAPDVSQPSARLTAGLLRVAALAFLLAPAWTYLVFASNASFDQALFRVGLFLGVPLGLTLCARVAYVVWLHQFLTALRNLGRLAKADSFRSALAIRFVLVLNLLLAPTLHRSLWQRVNVPEADGSPRPFRHLLRFWLPLNLVATAIIVTVVPIMNAQDAAYERTVQERPSTGTPEQLKRYEERLRDTPPPSRLLPVVLAFAPLLYGVVLLFEASYISAVQAELQKRKRERETLLDAQA